MPQLVGLDVGASAVRASEIELGGSRPSLTTFSQVGIPPGTLVDGEVRDATALTEAIKRLWQNGKFTSKSVVVGIAGLRVITRELDLPWVPDDEVDSAVRFQSEEVIPFTPDKTLLSVQVMGEGTAEDGSRTRRVLVAAAHRDLVDGIVAAAENAGLTVEGVDLVSSALIRALVDPATPSQEPEAIVSVGAALTVIVVHRAGRPLFVRTLGTGGHAGTEAISQALDIPVSDGEGLKRRLEGETAQVQAAQRAVNQVSTELASEIRNSIQYFSSLPGNEPVARILLTGGGAQLRGFVSALERQVGIPVVETSPLNRLDVSGLELSDEHRDALQPVLATSIGLVLPEPNPAVHKFNLVPPEIVRRAFERRVARYSYMAAAAVAVLLLAFGGWKLLSVHNAENKVNSLTASVNQLNAEIPTYNSVVRAVNELKTAKSDVTRLTAAGVDWSAVVAEIDRVAPSGLAITTFQGTSGTATARSGTSGTPGSDVPAGAIGSLNVSVSGTFSNTAHFSPVAEWIDAISGSKLFSPPSVTSVANAPSGGNTTVTFQSSLALTSESSLAQNASF